MTDGILLAELAARPAAAPLRHADHRRGARAQPEHRLHPRLPQAAAAAPPGPEGDHHLGDHRPGAVRARHFARRADHRGLRPDLPGGGPLPAARRRWRRGRATRPGASATRSTSCPPRDPATSWSSSAGEREIRDTADALAGPGPASRCCRCTRRLSAAEQHRVFQRPSGSCTRRVVLATNVAETSLTVPGIQLRHRPGHRAHLPVQPRGPRCSGCRSSRSRRPRPTSARAAAAGPPTASASGCTPRRTSSPGRSSPSRRSCAPTWPRSSCRWPRIGLGDIADVPVHRPARRRATSPTG